MTSDQSIHELLARVASTYRARRTPFAQNDIHASPEESVALTHAFARIADVETRRAVLDLVTALSRPAS